MSPGQPPTNARAGDVDGKLICTAIDSSCSRRGSITLIELHDCIEFPIRSNLRRQLTGL